MTATPDRCRSSAPPMCIRHELSAAHSTSAPVWRTAADLVRADRGRHVGVLHRERAAEPAAHLGVRQVGQVQAADRAQQPQRGVAHLQHPQRMAARVIRHPVREVRAHVRHPQHAGQEHRKLIGPRRDLGHRPGQARVPGLRRQRRVVLPDHRGTRGRRGDDGLVAGEGGGEPARHRHRLPPVTGVEMHLTAARLGRREIHLMAQPLEHRDHGLAGAGEQRVGQARHEQADAHQPPPPATLQDAVARRGRGDPAGHWARRPQVHPTFPGLRPGPRATPTRPWPAPPRSGR